MPEHQAQHENDNTSVRLVVYIMAVVAVFVPLCSLALWWGFNALGFNAAHAPGQRKDQPLAPPGQPQLQVKPREDLVTLQSRMTQQLTGTGWVDREAGIIHMPITRAETLLVERGLAVVERDLSAPQPESASD